MSTTTVSYRSTTRDADLAAVRRREAEAREAAREARRRAEEERRRAAEQRRREEAERRREEERQHRLRQLNQQVASQEARFQQLVGRLDEAVRRLPDLSLKAPRLTSLSGNVADDPDKLAAYTSRLEADVEAFSKHLDQAIAEGERLLKRRIAKASAWHRAADLKQRIELLLSQSGEAAAEIGIKILKPIILPEQPHKEADLEPVEAYEKQLQACYDEVRRQYDSLRARVRSHQSAIAIAGELLQTRGAQETLARHAEAERSQAMAALRAHRDAELARAGLRFEDLPLAVQEQIDATLQQAVKQDQRAVITRWIAREKQQREGFARALELMQSAPDLIHEDQALLLRWTSLTAQLQHIASGLEDFNPSVVREYEQLRIDASRLVNTAFTRADWVQAMCEQGFEVLEREDGQGLIVVDLDHPEIWLEATEYESEQGGFAATLELKTDAQLLPSETAITDAVCAKLARAASSGAPEVTTEAQVVEHENRIKRARRPTVAKKTFAQSL